MRYTGYTAVIFAFCLPISINQMNIFSRRDHDFLLLVRTPEFRSIRYPRSWTLSTVPSGLAVDKTIPFYWYAMSASRQSRDRQHLSSESERGNTNRHFRIYGVAHTVLRCIRKEKVEFGGRRADSGPYSADRWRTLVSHGIGDFLHGGATR